jgi:sulfur relay (sulfurtransferase) DsrC/TusE family protein
LFRARYSGSTPFWIACKHGHLGVLKKLSASKDLDMSVTVQGISALEIALRNGHIHVCYYLVHHLNVDFNTLPPTQVLLQQINRNLM